MTPQSSVFTPTFSFRRPDSGWVAYHDLQPVTGVAGLAMTWRRINGDLRYLAVVNRQRDGEVTSSGRLGETQDVTEVVQSAMRHQRVQAIGEWDTYSMLLPHRENQSIRFPDAMLPPFEEHRALAWRAVSEATLPPEMRSAFVALLDHGKPDTRRTLAELRRKSFTPEWQALAFAAGNPAIARLILGGSDAQVLSGSDPNAAVRARWSGLTEAHFRRMRSPDLLPFNSGHRSGPQHLELLFGSPADWIPEVEAWDAFDVSADTIRQIRAAAPSVLSCRALAASCGGDWVSFVARLRRASGVDEADARSRLGNKARDCADPIGSLSNSLLLPLIAARLDPVGLEQLEMMASRIRHPAGRCADSPVVEIARNAAAKLLYGDKSAPAVLEVSQVWHRLRGALEAETRGEDGAAEWPGLFDGVFRAGRVGVVCLKTYAELRDEGSRNDDGEGVSGLHHCVASRLPECLSGAAHVLSVRLFSENGSWRRLSTCQVVADRAPDGHVSLIVEEHRGYDNQTPAAEAVEAVECLSQAMRTGLVAASDAAIVRRRVGIGLAMLCGYDWRDPGAVACALRAWRPLLPRWARDLAPDDLYEALVERQIIPSPARAPVAFCIVDEDGKVVEVENEVGDDGNRYVVRGATAERLAEDGEVLGQFDVHQDRLAVETLIAELDRPSLGL